MCRHLHRHLAGRSRAAFGERILGPALRYSATMPLHFLQLVLPQGVRYMQCFLCVRSSNQSVPCKGTIKHGSSSSALAHERSTCPCTHRPTSNMQAAGDSALAAWRARLAYYVYEAVGAARIADMFDIVVDYPDRQVLGRGNEAAGCRGCPGFGDCPTKEQIARCGGWVA